MHNVFLAWNFRYRARPSGAFELACIRSDGVVFWLPDIYLGDNSSDDCGVVTHEYKIIGPRGLDTIAWLMRNFPEDRWINPERERIDAHASYVAAISRIAVEKYKRENGLT